MSSFSSKAKAKRPSAINCKENGKCGEITFCLQVGRRVYALNCLYCKAVYLQWDTFINHMEEEHDHELSSHHLLQQEDCEVLSNELADTADLDCSDRDPLQEGTDNIPAVDIKAESYQLMDQWGTSVQTDKQNNTCSSLDEEFLNRCNETSTRSCPEQIESHDYEDNNKSLQMEVSTDVVLSEINLKEILNCFRGQNVLTYYKANNCLDPKSRRVLCDLIIDKIFDRGWKMRSKDIPYIAEKIIQVFPSEDRLCEGNYDTYEILTQSSSSTVADDDKDGDGDDIVPMDKRKLTELIIQYYKEHSVLWDTTESGHGNNLKHREAYENITKHINARMDTHMKCLDIKIEIDKLKSKFRKEYKVVTDFTTNFDKANGNDGLGADSEVSSASWLYEKMIFLKDHIGCDRKRGKRGTKALANNKIYLPLSKHSLEENQQFIEYYKTYPCLWDVNHIDYRFKHRRLESSREMLDAVNNQMNLNLSLDDLQKKLYYIRYAFTQEKHRQIESEKQNRDHTPQCKLFNELSFLKDSVGPFKCEYCEELFNGPDQYKMHKSTHDGSMPYNCPICQKGFMKVGNCTVHLRRHTKDYQFDCKECGKKFPTSTDLNVHMRHHTGEKPYFCDVCGQSFRTWTYFDTHKKRHGKNPSHKCTICSKAFYENNKLKDHMKSHLNVRDKVCNVCGKSFTCSKYLSQHKQIHSEKKKYSCKICGKTFAQYGGLSGHIKSHATAVDVVDNDNITDSE